MTRPTAGRPSLHPVSTAQALIEFGADRIFQMVTEGAGYREIADAIPCGIGALYEWLALPSNIEPHAIAREIKADLYFAQTLQIADDGRSDEYIDEKGNKRTDNEVVQRSRLRVETRKWVAKCLNPAKYGEKVQVDQNVTLSPLADAFARMTAQGNAIPISTVHNGRMLAGVASASPLDIVDVPCVLCGDIGLPDTGCPICGVIDR